MTEIANAILLICLFLVGAGVGALALLGWAAYKCFS